MGHRSEKVPTRPAGEADEDAGVARAPRRSRTFTLVPGRLARCPVLDELLPETRSSGASEMISMPQRFAELAVERDDPAIDAEPAREPRDALVPDDEFIWRCFMLRRNSTIH